MKYYRPILTEKATEYREIYVRQSMDNNKGTTGS